MDPAPFSDARSAALLGDFLARNRQYAVIVLDPDGRVLDWLGAAEWLLGYSAGEMQGEPIARIFTPSDRERGMPEFELAVAGSTGASEDDRRHVRRDGMAIWVTGAVHAVRQHGRLVGYVKVLRDRSDLKTHIQILERRLEQAQERYRSLERALAILGHEVRGPLGIIKNSLYLLTRTQAPGAGADRQLPMIDRQVGLLQRLADDAMDAVRADTGKLRLNLAELDLNRLVQDVALMLAPGFAAHGLEFAALVPPSPTMVSGDEGRLRQVISNLLDNALKYTPAGGVVTVTGTTQADEARQLVQDNRNGISAQALARIFDLFAQEDRASPVSHGGLGVGLALVKQLTELHGGNVEARSPGEGQGSEFCVRLPLRR